MRSIIKVRHQAVKQAVKNILQEEGELEHYQSVYNQCYTLDELKLKEQQYGSVIAGCHPHRREYSVIVSECGLRGYGYRVSKYQIHLQSISQSQSDKEEAKKIEEWLNSKGV